MDYKPLFFRIYKDEEHEQYSALVKDKNAQVFDTIDNQLLEFLLCRNPSLSKEEVIKKGLVEQKLKDSGLTKKKYGVWVYYSWKNQLIHILDEEEFIEVRTNRNKYKITQEEQDILSTKKIGIAGLSVGRSVAQTIALERIAGEIRLADFDSIELSNLNRINAPLVEMGLNKSVAAAREIAEIDPYIKVTCFTEGLNKKNLESFFSNDGLLDLFIEECDDIAIKIDSRLVAKEFGVPVIMETNDNCIVDIERFDTEPDREIFHGRLNKDLLQHAYKANTIEDKTEILSSILEVSKISDRMKQSIPEIGKSIRSWPQTSSEVIYGGAISAAIARMILLKELNESDRLYLGLRRFVDYQLIQINK
ncbi:MAG: hypothetical protein HKP14_04015 [Bacteroidia bacterium]|nr:hypothetical protein [Bacteroidia bacterium]